MYVCMCTDTRRHILWYTHVCEGGGGGREGERVQAFPERLKREHLGERLSV